MKILVTGGAGYIGSVVVERLLVRGDSVIVLDDLSTGHAEALSNGVRFVKGRVGNSSVLSKLLAEDPCDCVLHFAASTEVGESMKKPGTYYRRNVSESMVLLEAMVEHDTRRIVFSSSAAVYGEPEKTPITEESPTNPTNPYGETKLVFERALEWHRRIHGVSSVSLRYFNAAGATGERGEDHSPETHLIPNVLKVPLGQRKEVSIFGDDYPTRDGSCLRDYVHVEDLAEAHIQAIDAMAEGRSGIFNLGSERGNTVLEVVRACEEVTGKRIPFKIVGRRPGDPATLVASSAKAKKELGWDPRKQNILEIVADAWKWMKEHPRGYASSRG
ncbi:MAG: UDP-glucose 4-epimerase GalE [Candidatus Eisenbacteria bacterium]|nr:UDP-glucose 4-epimerase GalE [Candidatus Eisenbacteria bacterium]